MTVPARLSLVTLAVPDVERAAAFYERLGVWELAHNPGFPLDERGAPRLP